MASLLSLLTLLSCGSNKNTQQDSNDGRKMIHFTYSVQGTMCYGTLYEAKKDNNKIVVLINHQEEKDHEYKTGESVFTDLQTIIDKNKMHKYKGSYSPLFEILDGESWSLNVKYEDESMNITAHGTNAGPGGYREAFREIADYFNNRFMKK